MVLVDNPIGILVDNFHLNIPDAIMKASELGADGIQFYAKNAMAPEMLNQQDRRDFVAKVRQMGMQISALCGDVGGFKFRETIPEHVEQTKRIIEMACDMNVPVVTAHIGAVPMSPAHPRYAIMAETCRQIADFAQSYGVYYAIETGPETSSVLCQFIEDVGSPMLKANLDPANLVMITGENPAMAVHRLKDKIVHTHIKDGRMNWFVEPEIVYGNVPDTEGKVPGHRDQTPLGEGNVPFAEFFKALDEIGYKGFLTVEREGGDDRVLEITNAVHTLRDMLGRKT